MKWLELFWSIFLVHNSGRNTPRYKRKLYSGLFLDFFTVKPIKPWTPKIISGTLPSKMSRKPLAEQFTLWTWNNKLDFSSTILNFFYTLWKYWSCYSFLFKRASVWAKDRQHKWTNVLSWWKRFARLVYFEKRYVSFGVCINIPFINSLVLPQNELVFGRHLMFSIPSVQRNTTTELRPK